MKMPNINLSLNDLKTFEKIKDIKRYKSMSEEKLISSIYELVKESKKNFDYARTEKIKKDFNELRDRRSKPKMKEIRKNLYRIENKKIKEIEKSLLKLEKVFPN